MAPGKALFIVNPISGNGKKRRAVDAIRRFYTGSPYEIVFTGYAGHATELAAGTDATLVVAVGGDGTVGEVANGILQSSIPGKTMGIIPCGSGDGLALHLGLSRNPRKAVQVLNDFSPVTMDAAAINGKAFFCTAGMGFDADVAEDFAASGHRGLATYISTALRLWTHFKPAEYCVVADGKKAFDGPATMLTAGNAGQWGNNARIAPLASVCDGLLDLTVVKPFSTWRIPYLAFVLMTGRAYRAREVIILKARNLTITRNCEGAVHYDGDPTRIGKEIEITINPSALRVAVPHSKTDKI